MDEMHQSGMNLALEHEPSQDYLQLDKLISDRGSIYSITASRVNSDTDVKNVLEELLRNKRYSKATHNSYACRFSVNDQIIERKADDGETGAGMVILRQIRASSMMNILVIVTRWYGGVKLHGDRFAHIQNGSRIILKQLQM
jgi:putative IMPACT (imprinted ancient) family translation regulator